MTNEVFLVRTAVHDFLLGMHAALAVWFVVVALGVVSCAVVLLPMLHDRYQRRRARIRRAQEHRTRQAEELDRYAQEIAVAAARAELTAQRLHAEWDAVCRTRDEMWRAYLDADTTARSIAGAAAFPIPEGVLAPVQTQERERYLHQAATQAYRRGELTVAQLNDVLSQRNGWDPHRNPADQEVTLRRIARQRRREAYLAVTAIERTARHAAEIATAAKRSLQDEAFNAALRAHRARHGLPANAPVRSRHAQTGHAYTPRHAHTPRRPAVHPSTVTLAR